MSNFATSSLRMVNRCWNSAVHRSVVLSAKGLAQLERRRPTMLSQVEGSAPLGPRVALFCHWDGRGRIQEHVRRYVAALREQHLSVVFISNAGWLAKEDADWAASACSSVILRRNIGYDFGCWREAMLALGLPRAETSQIILVNDSVYGPFFRLDDVMRRIEAARLPICGLTDSWQRRYHLQSYFVAIAPEAFRSEVWSRFWKDILPSRSKTHVVEAYEIGFTQAMLRGGLGCGALWPYEDLVDRVAAEADAETRRQLAETSEDGPKTLPDDPLKARARDKIAHLAAARIALNPTADLWSALLALGFPFLKRELVRSNPTRVMDVARWRGCVGDISMEEQAVIRRDLMLALRRSAP